MFCFLSPLPYLLNMGQLVFAEEMLALQSREHPLSLEALMLRPGDPLFEEQMKTEERQVHLIVSSVLVFVSKQKKRPLERLEENHMFDSLFDMFFFWCFLRTLFLRSEKLESVGNGHGPKWQMELSCSNTERAPQRFDY